MPTLHPILPPFVVNLYYYFVSNTIVLYIIRIMERILVDFAKAVDYKIDIREPLNTDGAQPKGNVVEVKVEKIQSLIRKPAFELSDLPAYWDAIKNANTVGLDDRQLLLEKVLVLMSRLQGSPISDKIQQFVINLLYKDLPHPPSGYLCLPPSTTVESTAQEQALKYAFRSGDGSKYNPLFPTLGKAGSPYARSVPSICTIPQSALPDAGLVFDTLLRRDSKKFTPHPGGISALFFAFADLVIHSIFNTNNKNWTVNDASSYLDLSILYGSSDTDVQSVRVSPPDGTGRLWEDVFADNRLRFMPPASCALLVLLSRNHNYIAQRILDINERGEYKPADQLTPEKLKSQDDEIFHRARLVNCGYFMQIILGDYVGAILGLVRDGSSWRLDPLMTIRESDHDFAPRGEGNVVSIEFNLLYRWHSTLSEQDAEWTGGLFKTFFGDTDPTKATIDDFKNAAHKFMMPQGDVREWTFADLKRDPATRRFSDDDLARLLHNSTEWVAGAFQARGTPEVLRVIELLGIEQSRSWGTCSMNEFRKFLGLKPYKTFEEWNPDKEIHMAAAALYKDIDNLELHVGLQAEQTKLPGPGAGLCPGYTISRAILADAVCLTRGDRFFTVDFTPFNLTSWGYLDCQYDQQDGSYGGMLTKLLFRTLPDHYPAGSAYAHFPFMVPEKMKKSMATSNPDVVNKYTWTRPRRYSLTVPVETYEGVNQILSQPDFLAAYDDRLYTIVKPVAKQLTKDALMKRKAEVAKLVFQAADADLSGYFAKKTLELIRSKAFCGGDPSVNYVDIVKDVINLIPVHWISQKLAGLPLKTETFSSGAKYELEMYDMFADVARYIYLNFDPVHDWRLRESSQATFKEIACFVEGHFDKLDSLMRFSLTDRHNHTGIENYDSHKFLEKVDTSLRNVYSNTEKAAEVLAAVVPTASLFSQAIAHIVNFYLSNDKKEAREHIVKLIASKEKDGSSRVMPYIREALRLDPSISGVYRTAAKDIIVDTVRVQAGQQVFASIVKANLDPSVFGPDPSVPNYTRQANEAGVFNLGEHGLLSSKFFESTVPAIVGTILGLKDLKRGPNKSGFLTSFTEQWHGSDRKQYISTSGVVTPWPDSLIVQFSQ